MATSPTDETELKQALNDQTVAIEELQVLMQALFDQQTSLLVREMCRTANRREPKEGQVCTVLTPMPTIDELDQLEEKTMVSVNPDEDQTPSAEDEAEENQNHLQVPHDTRLSTQSTVTQRSTTTGIDVVALNTSDSMNPVQRLPVSEVVQAASTLSTSKRDSGRYTFVRANMDQHQERATSVALERGINGAVNLARRASQYQPHIDQSNANSQFLFNLVTSRRFMHGMMLVILLNLILLGIEVEISSKKSLDDISPFFFIANIIIVCVYVIEMLLKMTAFGVAGFFLGTERAWNNFDFAIILVSVIETLGEVVATATAASSNVESNFFRVVRFIRLARALRGIRVIRLIHYVGALRTLVFAIISTAASLFWTLVLLCLVFYIFGVILAQITSDHCRLTAQLASGDPNAVPSCTGDDGKALTLYWSGVLESMFTLFMVVSGGVNWEDIVRPLQKIGTTAVVCLVAYIIISVFTILNVVTGVFCNTAIESAHADRDIAIMKQLLKKQKQVNALKEIFQEIDHQNSESVNILDLKAALEGKKLSTFMESLGINTEDIWTLFMIIDADESGEITLDEFVTGCMQLHGPAKSLQLAKMSYENKVTRREISRLGKQVAVILKYFNLQDNVRLSSGSSMH